MDREQFEHAIRAASAVLNEDELVVIGSQSILGVLENPPKELLESGEVDVYAARGSPDQHEAGADLLEGALGPGSLFEKTHRFCVDGVSPRTARLPGGWEQRVHAVRTEGTKGATAYCIDATDLAVAKMYAGRDKDLAYVRALVEHRIVRGKEFEERLGATEMEEEERRRIRDRMRTWRRRAHELADMGRRYEREAGGTPGRLEGAVNRKGEITLRFTPEGKEGQAKTLGVVHTGREMALVKSHGGEIRADEVWEWEKTLERERRIQQQRALEQEKAPT